MASIEDLVQAIARYEGYYSAGSVASRNNNPGNLRSWGDNPVVDGFARFPSADAGFAALRSQVERNIGRGLSLNEFFAGKAGVYPGYAPAADNNRPYCVCGYRRGLAGRAFERSTVRVPGFEFSFSRRLAGGSELQSGGIILDALHGAD